MNPLRAFCLGLVIGCGAACTKHPASSSQSAPAGPIMVDSNVLVSADMKGWDHTEYMSDADPGDPNRLVLCSMYFSQDQNQLASGIYLSSDGGRSWQLTKGDASSRFDGVWDPACAFGTGRDAWFMTIVADFTKPYPTDGPEEGSYKAWKVPGRSRLHVFRSGDGAASWTQSPDLGFIDNENITVDRTGGRFNGRVYVYGNTLPWTDVWLVYSADRGQTFRQSAATRLKSGEALHAGPGAVLTNGTLLLPYEVFPSDESLIAGRVSVAVAASTDGGAHVGLPVTVAPRVACQRMKDSNTRDLAASAGPSTTNIAVDRSLGPFQGRIYVEWASMDRDQCAVFVASSSDGGRKWSPPVRVSDAPLLATRGPDVFLPEIAVNKDGVVAATWYDRRDATNHQDHRLRVSASLDGGDTWLPSQPVSTAPFVFKSPPEWRASADVRGGGRRSRAEANRTDTFDIEVFPGPRLYDPWNNGMGDYGGIAAAADGRFHVFWIDNRSGVAQVYTAAVTVSGRPSAAGSQELTGLENVTKLIELQDSKSVFDPQARTLVLEVQMLNTSLHVIDRPIKLRMLAMTSDVGPPTVVTDGENTLGPGAVIDISSAVPAGGLLPGATSTVSRLKLQFRPGDLVLNPRGNTEIAHLQARLFGKIRK